MTKQKTEDFRKQLAKKRQAAAMEEEIQRQEMLKRNQTVANPQSIDRTLDIDDGIDLNQIYNDFVKKYKKENPDFDEDKNNIKAQGGGVYTLTFEDPNAEEAFLRHAAGKGVMGSVYCGANEIAKFRNGELIDPRTNEAFPKGGYANLVQQLDSGIAYKDIPLPKSTAPTPFSTTPE